MSLIAEEARLEPALSNRQSVHNPAQYSKGDRCRTAPEKHSLLLPSWQAGGLAMRGVLADERVLDVVPEKVRKGSWNETREELSFSPARVLSPTPADPPEVAAFCRVSVGGPAAAGVSKGSETGLTVGAVRRRYL